MTNGERVAELLKDYHPSDKRAIDLRAWVLEEPSRIGAVMHLATLVIETSTSAREIVKLIIQEVENHETVK